MNPESPNSEPEASDELTGLIKTLHETDSRLDVLTQGEVDTVTDRRGQSSFLRRAQDKLRYGAAAKQAAIIDSLPAHIALLDARGVIISVNAAWRRFARLNFLKEPESGVGCNYLSVCDRATECDAPEAHLVAAGIRAVLSREVGEYSIEYPCNSPTADAWYLLTVTPIDGAERKGAVAMHLNITERKHGEQALQEFGAAMNATADSIYLVDRLHMRFVYVNDTACRMLDMPREHLLRQNPWEILATPRADLEAIYDSVIAGSVDAPPVEVLRAAADGSKQWLEFRRQARRTGERWTIVSVVRDVTERKQTEIRVAHLNRVYAMLSGINALIVHESGRDDMFRSACRIAVDQGGFRMAWIGILDAKAMTVAPMASAVVADARRKAPDLPVIAIGAGTGPDADIATRAIRSKIAVAERYPSDGPELLVDQPRVDFGIRSAAMLPLLVAGSAVGLLALYSDDIDCFNPDEVKLLTELASDIAFGVDHIGKQEQLHYLAYYDVLTGLANRGLFLERVAQYTRGATAGGHRLAIFLIDLERFRNINDSLGQSAGDELLRQVGGWLTQFMGEAGLVARVGANLFAVVLPTVSDGAAVASRIEKTMAAFLEHPFRLNDAVFRISAKVGVALFPDDGDRADLLFRNAEAALKCAKTGGDRYLFYSRRMTESVAGRLTTENKLRQALEKGEYVLHYQPQISLTTGVLTGVEALLRWNDPRTGLVPPAQFIPILEDTGLILAVGRWVLHTAIEQYLRWLTAGLPAVRIAVNVSPLQLRNRGFIAEIRDAIGIDPRAADGLELEITETLIMEDIKLSVFSLQAIRGMGVPIAIDDFGTGFSSLNYLAKLRVDTLKIDQSFVSDLNTGPEALALVSTIITLAHALRLNVVAEGVETPEQARLLRLLHCDEMQGFLSSKPLPGDEFAAQFLSSPSTRRFLDSSELPAVEATGEDA